jgi:hypothetical protein
MVVQTNTAPKEADAMNTKIRTTIIALVASASFGVASVAPAVSQATKNTGAYSKSSEAYKKAQQEELCGNLSTWWNNEDADYVGALAAKDKTLAAALKANMDAIGKLARKYGCGWGQEVAPESPTSLAETPAVVAQGSPEGGSPVEGVQPTPLALAR